MRIITGKYKGRIIKVPKGIRPTQNKIRKALFDILGDIEGLSFLELFAGSGAVGLEALSQGANEVVFVEKYRGCIEKVKQNLSVLEFSSSRVLELDALEVIGQLDEAGDKFDIIFLDPPYYKSKASRPSASCIDSGSLAKKTLQTISSYDILAPNGFIVVQHFKKDTLADSLGVLTLFRQARYGDTILSFYRKVNPKSQ